MLRSGEMRLRRVRHAPWVPVALTVVAATLGACGDGGGGENGAATTSQRSDDRAAGSEKIVIKAHADLRSVVDKGEVLSGSSLGAAPFCQEGTFTGAHGTTAVIDRMFKC